MFSHIRDCYSNRYPVQVKIWWGIVHVNVSAFTLVNGMLCVLWCLASARACRHPSSPLQCWMKTIVLVPSSSSGTTPHPPCQPTSSNKYVCVCETGARSVRKCRTVMMEDICFSHCGGLAWKFRLLCFSASLICMERCSCAVEECCWSYRLLKVSLHW